MEFKNIKTGEVVDCWEHTECSPDLYGGCNNCPIHKRYDKTMNRYTYCGEIVEQYPEAARLIGYEPMYEAPQPEGVMDAKLLNFFRKTYKTLNTASFCWGVSCDRCPFNTPLGQPCGANQIMEAMEKMAGASAREFEED